MKKKVVHTRLPEDLFDEIVAKAKKNRTTVSSLVRNLVEDFLDIAEDLSDIASEKTRKVLFGKEKGDVIGYQSFTLLKDTNCERCEKDLKKGEAVQMALYENSSEKDVFCKACLEQSTKKKKTS